MRASRFLVAAVVLSLFCAPAAFAQDGNIEGQVTLDDGSPIGGVAVVVTETGTATVTDSRGNYLLTGLAAGDYTLSYSFSDHVTTETGVTVGAGETTQLDKSVDWEVSFADTIVVVSASRRAERIVEAPQAVTVVSEKEIEREASHGQVPKLIEFTPGAEVTQSGLYDYNINTRGFNSSLNRRVASIVDGRDPSVPFLGSQDWASVTYPLDDLSSVEFVRGPSAALYGANASSGVLNLTTKQPRYSQGGQVNVAAGELSTLNADLRWATGLSENWFFKIQGGVRNSGDFSVSRNGQAEYTVPCGGGRTSDCLPQEVVPLNPENDDEITFASARLDYYTPNGSFLTFEGGTADVGGPVVQTGIGRVQLVDVERPWVRVNYTAPHWNALVTHQTRDASKQTALSSGTNLVLDTENTKFELRGNWDFADGDARLIAGASHKDETIDSFDPGTGRQSLVFQPIDSDSQAVYGQLDWTLSDNFKLVLAGRWDDSTLHDSQVSPKGALVYSINPNNTLRLTYNEAFQVANYSEFFLQANVAPPVNAQAIEGVCALAGVNCGFGSPVRVLALGNEDLEVETIKTVELGYSGIVNDSLYLTIDYYSSQSDNFITDLLPQLGTSLGRVNPNFGPYQPPAELPEPFRSILLATLQGALGPSFAILTNNLDGSPILGAVSYTNFGKVDTQGIDLGLNYYIDGGWTLAFNYSWFDFDIKNDLPGFDSLLLPNSPKNKASVGVSKVAETWDASVDARWVDDFRWGVGPFQGDVDSYTTVDLGGNYIFNDNWAVGLNVSNLLDSEHYQSFGGDLLGRRALANVRIRW